MYPFDDNDREADDSYNETKDHQKSSPNGVEGFEGSSVDFEVENAGENKQQAGGCCRSHNSKDIFDIRHKDGQQQHHTQDDESQNDVDRPGEGTSFKHQRDSSLSGRKLNKGYSQQHREQDGQSNHHHHDVPRHVRIVAKQQLRVHLIVEGEVAKQSRNEVNQEAEANTDICNLLHLGFSRSV